VENYLSEYLPILIFIIIGFAIAIGMTTYLLSLERENLIMKNFLHMNVALKHLTTLEEGLM
jgi:NADH:ubiquinone oxidoreductase subunit 3 (subunit A)